MKPVATVLILTHRGEAERLRHYFISLVAREWEAHGIRVRVHSDPDVAVPADICLLHVDRSVVDSHYTDFAGNYPYSGNLHVTDIRKRRYSRNQIQTGDGYEGPVIVKSSLNCAGLPELGDRPHRTPREFLNRFNRSITGRVPSFFPFQQPAISGKAHYRIFPERRMLPVGWLSRQDIVIERFRPERHENHYVLREWYFLGDKEFFNCEISKDPVFTSGAHCPELAEAPPEAIRQIRRDMRVDYGKIDYVVEAGGTAILYDVNKTIGVSNPDSPLALGIASTLAGGLSSLFEGERWK